MKDTNWSLGTHRTPQSPLEPSICCSCKCARICNSLEQSVQYFMFGQVCPTTSTRALSFAVGLTFISRTSNSWSWYSTASVGPTCSRWQLATKYCTSSSTSLISDSQFDNYDCDIHLLIRICLYAAANSFEVGLSHNPPFERITLKQFSYGSWLVGVLTVRPITISRHWWTYPNILGKVVEWTSHHFDII